MPDIITRQVSREVPFAGAEGKAAYWLVEVTPTPGGEGQPVHRMNFARCEGHLSVRELLALLAMIDMDRDGGPDLPTLWDMRDHDFSQVSANFARALAYALSKVPERVGTRRGFLVNDVDGYATMRLFQQVVSGYGIDSEDVFLVSYDAEEVLDWLCEAGGP